MKMHRAALPLQAAQEPGTGLPDQAWRAQRQDVGRHGFAFGFFPELCRLWMPGAESGVSNK